VPCRLARGGAGGRPLDGPRGAAAALQALSDGRFGAFPGPGAG